MYKIEFNGYTMQNSANLVITGLTGIDRVGVRVSEANRTGLDGGVIYARKKAIRRIAIAGELGADDMSTYYSERDAMTNAFDLGASGDLVISVLDNEGTTVVRKRAIPAKVVELPQFQEEIGEYANSQYDITLACEDPNFVDPEENAITETINLAESTGSIVAMAVATAMGAPTTDRVTVTNSGAIAVYPSIVITGPVVSPVITNLTTGHSVGIDTTLTATDEVVIFQTTSGVYYRLNGAVGDPTAGTNYYQYKVGDLFLIEPGDNIIRYQASGYNATTTATISFRVAYPTL